MSCFFPKKISDILEPGYQADAQRIPDTGSEDVVFNLLDVNNHETSLLFVSQGLEDLSPSPPSKQRKVTRWTHIISVRFLPFSSYELPTCHFSRFRGDVLDLEMFYLQLLNDTPTALTYQKQHVLFQRTLVNCGMASPPVSPPKISPRSSPLVSFSWLRPYPPQVAPLKGVWCQVPSSKSMFRHRSRAFNGPCS